MDSPPETPSPTASLDQRWLRRARAAALASILIAFLGWVAGRSVALEGRCYPFLLCALIEASFAVLPVLLMNVFALLNLRSKAGNQRPGRAAVVGWAGVAAGMFVGVLELHRMYADDWEGWGLVALSITFGLGQLALALCATKAHRLMPPGSPQKPSRPNFEKISGVVVYGLLVWLTVVEWTVWWHRYPAPGEASTVGDLRTINTALITYASTYGKGYPTNLKMLGPPAKGARESCLAAGLIDEFLAGGLKRGYQYTYKPGTPHKPERTGAGTTGCPEGFDTYTITLSPWKHKHYEQEYRTNYFTDESGVIRGPVKNRPATVQDPPLG